MPTVRVTATPEFKINIYIDSEQVCFSETIGNAINYLIDRGMQIPVAKSIVNACLPKQFKTVCGYKQSEISITSNNCCVNCFHLKKEHPVG